MKVKSFWLGFAVHAGTMAVLSGGFILSGNKAPEWTFVSSVSIMWQVFALVVVWLGEEPNDGP